jgi:hypothetical protein
MNDLHKYAFDYRNAVLPDDAHEAWIDLEQYVTEMIAAEREAIKWNSIHSCHADCQNPACVIVREAIAAEREACAKAAEERLLDKANCTAEQMYEMLKKSIAEAIRARGHKL